MEASKPVLFVVVDLVSFCFFADFGFVLLFVFATGC